MRKGGVRHDGRNRSPAIAQLYAGTYVAYGKVKVAEYMTHWLEEVMRKRITNDSYHGYRNVVNNYIIPQIGKKYMVTVMVTSMEYAKSKKIISINPAEGVRMPKTVKKKKYREREIKNSEIWIISAVPLMVIREPTVFIIRSYWQSR